MERLFNGNIVALAPEYVEGKGDCTRVYLENKDPYIVEKKTKSLINTISRRYMIDLKEVKKRYRPLVSSPNTVPIPFSKDDIFIPFKTRVPICKSDGATSYINLRYIKGVKDGPNVRTINLNNEFSIECLWKISTINNHIRNGNIVKKFYEECKMKVREEEEEYFNIMVPVKVFENIVLKSSGKKGWE